MTPKPMNIVIHLKGHTRALLHPNLPRAYLNTECSAKQKICGLRWDK